MQLLMLQCVLGGFPDDSPSLGLVVDRTGTRITGSAGRRDRFGRRLRESPALRLRV